jgi:hypothetical protein
MKKIVAATCLSVAAFAPAQADVITLNFEGILTPAQIEAGQVEVGIGDFYNGGTSAGGTSGANHGIEFSPNAMGLCLSILYSATCTNSSHGGQGVPGSERGGLHFGEGYEMFMNNAAGFDTGFAFNYASVYYTGSVGVWSGLNGTGTLLATLNLDVTPSTCVPSPRAYCPFFPVGLSFSGIAHSVVFGGWANGIVFDDVTFGSASIQPATPVPEPETYTMLLGGLGLLGVMARRRQKRR